MGRPRKPWTKQQVMFRFDPALVERLKQESQETGCTRSEIVRSALLEALERRNPKKEAVPP
jgi:hypothetical protein